MPLGTTFGVPAMQPTNIHAGKTATAILCGKAIPWGQNNPVFVSELAAGVLAEHGHTNTNLCYLELPPIANQAWFGAVREHPNYRHFSTTSGDAIILREPGQAVALVTRDCLTGVIESPSGLVGVFHGSRETLAHDSDGLTVACRTLEKMGHSLGSREARGWRAHLTAGICGHHFLHDVSHPQVGHYMIHGGPGALIQKADQVGISLRHVVRHILDERGFGERRVTTDHYCTFANKGLGSKRRDQEGGAHNLIIVVKR